MWIIKYQYLKYHSSVPIKLCIMYILYTHVEMLVLKVLFTLYILFIFICRHFNLSSRSNLQYYSYSKEIDTSEFADDSNNLIMNETLYTVYNI